MSFLNQEDGVGVRPHGQWMGMDGAYGSFIAALSKIDLNHFEGNKS